MPSTLGSGWWSLSDSAPASRSSGRCLTARGGVQFGRVGYAPLSGPADPASLPDLGLDPGVPLLIWLALIVVWVVVGAVLLRSRPGQESGGPAIT